VLLVEPVEQFLRFRPIRRSLDAMQKYDREIGGASPARAGIDSRFQCLLTQTAVDLCEPWRIRRRGGHEDEMHDWHKQCASHAKVSSTLLEEYARWARDTKEDAGADNRKENKGKERRYATWWRQDRSVITLLEMEISFRDLGMTWFAEAWKVPMAPPRPKALSSVRHHQFLTHSNQSGLSSLTA
jgi:hypothetical protein